MRAVEGGPRSHDADQESDGTLWERDQVLRSLRHRDQAGVLDRGRPFVQGEVTLRLVELEPTFLSVVSPGHWQQHDEIAKADGVEFLCPVCWIINNGSVGTHAVICWQP